MQKYKCLLPEEENKRNSDTTGKFHVLATKLKTDEEAKFKLTDAETEISFSSDRSSHSLHYNSVTTLPLANSAETSTKNKSVLTNAENLSPEFHLKHSSINVSKNILTNSSQQKEETSNFKSNLTTNEWLWFFSKWKSNMRLQQDDDCKLKQLMLDSLLFLPFYLLWYCLRQLLMYSSSQRWAKRNFRKLLKSGICAALQIFIFGHCESYVAE